MRRSVAVLALCIGGTATAAANTSWMAFCNGGPQPGLQINIAYKGPAGLYLRLEKTTIIGGNLIYSSGGQPNAQEICAASPGTPKYNNQPLNQFCIQKTGKVILRHLGGTANKFVDDLVCTANVKSK